MRTRSMVSSCLLGPRFPGGLLDVGCLTVSWAPMCCRDLINSKSAISQRRFDHATAQAGTSQGPLLLGLAIKCRQVSGRQAEAAEKSG